MLGPMPPTSPPSSPASPGTMQSVAALSDAEIRLAKLEESNKELQRLLADKAAQELRDLEETGLLGRAVTRVFGKSWSTSFYGLLAGASGIVAIVPDLPTNVHKIAGVATAVGTLMLGISAKSKNVTGVERPKA